MAPRKPEKKAIIETTGPEKRGGSRSPHKVDGTAEAETPVAVPVPIPEAPKVPHCPICGYVFHPDMKAGQKVQCPNCSHDVELAE